MTRDLPFDDDSEAADCAGDTAYRVATGVARVARAGAYVTGGALVAANGGGVPAQPGASRLDSWNTGWAHSTDPDPDEPSPVITFPDPVVEPAPYTPHPRNPQVAAHGEGSAAFPLPGTGAGNAGLPLPTLDGEYNGTDAGLPLPSLPGGDAGGYGMHLPGSSGGGVPGLGGIPGTAGNASPGGFGIPGTEDVMSGELPGRSESSADVELPGGHGFGLPGHGLGQAGHGFGLPGANGFAAPGSTVFDLPGGHSGTPAASDPFAGVGAGGDQLGVFVGTEWSVDFELGPNGVYFTSEMKVDVAVGQVGDQLDQFTDWLGDGMHVPEGTSHSVTDAQTPGQGNAGLAGGVGTPVGGTHAGHSSASSAVAQPAAQPLAASAPLATAPATVAPTAPFAPAAPVAPAAPAAVATAPVVAATPLQTTIQPDAASTPIANVLAAPEGQSMLTAPAAVVPALFDHARPTPPGRPGPAHDTHSSDPAESPSTPPTTIIKTTSTPTIPGVTAPTTPAVPKTPDHDVTRTPGTGVTTAPHGGITTAPDVTATKVPAATGTQNPAPTTLPDDDVTSPGGAGAPSTGAGTPHPTRPTHQPTDDVPTVSVPAQPTAVPTHSVPTHAPSADIDPYTPPVVPTHVAPAPTQAPVPVKPQIEPKPQGISAPLAIDHPVDPGFAPLPVAEHAFDDHALLAPFAGGSLSAALLPESTLADTHHTAHGLLDISLM